MKKTLLCMLLFVPLLFLLNPTALGNAPAEMPAVRDAACWSCHPGYCAVLQNQFNSTPIVKGNHPIGGDCYRCHTTLIQQNRNFRYCTVCHYPGGSLGLTNYFSHRHTSDGRQGFLKLPNIRHPLAGIHAQASTACNLCHATTLTAEHNRAGRSDRYGNPVNCDTCHTGSGLADRLGTNGTLRILKTQDYQLQWSQIYYAPGGQTISRVRVTHALNSSNYFEVHAFTNGKWGIVYYRTSGVADRWFDLPYPATAVRTRLHAPYAAPAGMWGGDVPEVELTARPQTNPRYAKVKGAVQQNDKRCEACHDPADSSGHPSHAVEVADFCKDCHGVALTSEQKRHANDCGSCHQSGDPLVQQAIRDGRTDCAACHAEPFSGHPAHTVLLDKSCASCHGTSMTEEPVRHRGDCGSCHDSELEKVKEAIRLSRQDCFSCHTEAHGVGMLSLPSDIPLDPRFVWSKPEPPDIWAGEAWMPANQISRSARIIYSNRQPMPVMEVWESLLHDFGLKGWSRDILQDVNEPRWKFSVLRKGSSRCFVWVFSGDYPGAAGGSAETKVFMICE